MTKLQLLHRALNERLMAAVEQIMEMVGGTVLEYEEETIRARKENEVLRRRLRWMEGANRADWPGPSETVTLSTTDEASPSRQDEGTVNIGCGPGSEALVIKTESTEIPLCSVGTLPQSIDQGPDNAGTGAGIAYGLVDSMTWDSAQSYMAPLDFDPTSGPSRVRHWRGQNRRQRMSFACPDCGKVFASKQRLMIHMRIHSTERPYAYRRRKECFYGDNKKKRKLHRLSQLSRETVDDLSDGSEQMNRSEEEPESDHNNSDKEPENRITPPVQKRRKKRGVVNQMCRCPHCPQRVFARPCQLALHMKTHSVTALINLPARAQSGTQEIVDVKRKLPKRQRKNDVEKEAKVADKRKLQCPECGKVFLHAGWYRVHMRSHNTKKVLLRRSLQIKTERIKEETTVAVPKTTEVQKVKKVKKKHACPHCDKVFTREGWLEPHIRSQHGELRNRSDYLNVYGSGRTRSQQLATKRLRKRKTQKRQVTKKMILNSQKTKGLRKVKNKLRQTSDDGSILGVDVPAFTKDEDEESADLPNTALDESESASEQSKDISGSDCGTSSTKYLKRRFSCKICGKDFALEKKLKKHSKKHVGYMLKDEKKRRRVQTKMETELKEKEKRKWEGKKRLDDELSASNKKTNTTTPHGSPNKDTLRKSRTRGQGPLPCPFCGKVFAWEMRLLMHMQIHCGEKPYAYRQRKKRFYGDLKRGRRPKIHNQEPSGDKSDESEESGSEETLNKDGSAHLKRSATRAVSGALASRKAIEQPTTSYKSNQRTKTKLVSDIMSHFNMQPRIVLQPIMTACKYWSSVPGGADSKSGCSEKSSGSGHEKTSARVGDEMVDAVKDKIADSNLCTLPVEFSGHGIQNKPEICYNETEIVCVKVGSPQRDPEVEHDNIGGTLAFESSEVNNTKSQQKGDCNVNFPGVSENTARDQVPCIVIDDDLEQPDERTAAEKKAPSECGRRKCDWKCDCKNISAMKLTVMPQKSVFQSFFKETGSGTMKKNVDTKLVCVVLSDIEDDLDEDVLTPSKGLDKKKTASAPIIQIDQLDVVGTPGKNPSSDSNFPAPDATDSTKSIDGASHHISTDPGRDQMASTAIRQTEDMPMSSKERMSCQTSDTVFARPESLSDVNVDKKLLDMETGSSSERKNKKLGLKNQLCNSSRLKNNTDSK
ncbi:uncharacterized protein LOC113046886 isoform X2 [Carassius auratus]|uniref:Uncharacterized protein LOC113046886 isoform X2 n=1 Tax=Carassius auratus TaxID=7957 RepID=A0A6P6JV80_CARAU|nr:uncharacterized protein LOC113046886 isoform X2 [Carassius auratus]